MLDLRLAVTQHAYGTSPVKVRCVNPNHTDPTASMAVYLDNIHCFGCGFHVNDPDEALSLLLGVSEAEARAILPRLKSNDFQRQEAKPLDPLPSSLADVYHRVLYGNTRRHRLKWLLDRGLTHETIAEFRLGHNGVQFTIPVWDRAGNLVTIRYRKDDVYLPDFEEDGYANPKYSGMRGRNGVYIVPEQKLDRRTWAVLTESELCAIRLWQDDVPAVSATNGARNCHKVPSVLARRYPYIRTLYIATDQDEAGDEAAEKTAEECKRAGIAWERLAWKGAKDVTDHLNEGGRTFERLKKRHERPTRYYFYRGSGAANAA